MKLPDKIKIGPHVYTVKYEKGFAGNHNAIGQSRHTSLEIVIDPDQAASQLADTIIHEVLHCINRQIGFTEKEHDAEEVSINALATMLLSVSRENKELMKLYHE